MIYVVGHKFKVNNTRGPSFIKGNEYKIFYIKPIREEKAIKFNYMFLEMNTQKSFSVVFSSTMEADVSIARMSDTYEELQKERARIIELQSKDVF